MTELFTDKPTLEDMARLAKLLGCESEAKFVGFAMRASGGKFNPAHLEKVFSEAKV
jgi:Asp-tRNA(Asn)/Glu-tRNA(Gln) amidotransferase B subunit